MKIINFEIRNDDSINSLNHHNLNRNVQYWLTSDHLLL